MNYQRNYISPYNIIISVIVPRIICYICVYYLECIPLSVDSHVEYFYLRHLEANTNFAPFPSTVQCYQIIRETLQSILEILLLQLLEATVTCHIQSMHCFSLDKHNFIYKSFSLIYYSYSFFQPFSLTQIAAYELSFFQSL